MNILFFGDSITWGAWDKESGWVARIKRFVDEKVIASNFEYYHDVYNVGISGDKTADLLDRFEFEAKNRIDEENEILFIFAIGVNDSQFVESEGHRTPLPQFQKNVKTLIQKARKMSDKIVFMGLFPVDDSKLNPMPDDTSKSYKLEYVKKYDQALKETCVAEKVDFIDIYGKLVGEKYQEFLIDGLHPNTEGHKRIYEIVLKFLLDKKYL